MAVEDRARVRAVDSSRRLVIKVSYKFGMRNTTVTAATAKTEACRPKPAALSASA